MYAVLIDSMPKETLSLIDKRRESAFSMQEEEHVIILAVNGSNSIIVRY